MTLSVQIISPRLVVLIEHQVKCEHILQVPRLWWGSRLLPVAFFCIACETASRIRWLRVITVRTLLLYHPHSVEACASKGPNNSARSPVNKDCAWLASPRILRLPFLHALTVSRWFSAELHDQRKGPVSALNSLGGFGRPLLE